ncbi:MAG: flagellin lysine-N-methylase [Candidatus Delongbacteria bacterium]|nr:flagellin lysine-N-methylase [Candidatus Delongbacteria bacterium]
MATKQISFAKEKVVGTFLVPDYYKNFQCKGGDCRDSCCVEWKVTIPMEQYFLLHGLKCKATVKEKIDRAFRPLINPTKERYAEIVHNYDGDCPLHKKDGYCLLHETCGEEVLPWVCRYYPRGPRIDLAYEASCANSCEKTLELLFEDTNILSFEKRNLSFLINKPKEEAPSERKSLYIKVRDNIFSILTNRNYPLHLRMIHLGQYLNAMTGNTQIDIVDIDFSFDLPECNINENHQVLWSLLDLFNSKYKRLDEQLSESRRNYLLHDVVEVYSINKEHLDKTIEDHEIFFEKMLINDLFFKQFPFQSNFSVHDQFLSVCGIYVLLRYLTLNLMSNKNTKNDFIDILAKSFTVISHSEFDKLISSFMKRLEITDLASLSKILQM